MKRLTALMVSTSMALAATPALASKADVGFQWAKVVDARPIVERVRIPVEEQVCWDEQVWRRDPVRRSAAPVILGTIIGGVIGNQFGGGRGRVAMTAAGAALGGSIAADSQHRRNPDGYYAVTETRCGVETNWRTEERVVAWDVTYKYRGEIHQTRMRNEPRDRIRVRVEVNPLDY